MTGWQSAELVRLPAVDGASATDVVVPDWASTILVQNALDARVFIAWRRTPEAAAGSYDVVTPGAALHVHPVPSRRDVGALCITVDYTGAVPSDDAGLFVIVTAMEAQLAPSVGPLA